MLVRIRSSPGQGGLISLYVDKVASKCIVVGVEMEAVEQFIIDARCVEKVARGFDRTIVRMKDPQHPGS
jgi:hypothetical protein